MPLTYGKYLKVQELLDLQKPLSESEHDEMLFIIIHQVYELWFKQLLHEASFLVTCLQENRTPESLATFKRMLTILKTLVSQVDVIETMTPLSFSTFRDHLESSSGFQSCQFREVEFLLGHKRPEFLQYYEEDSPERKRLQQRLDSPDLYQLFLQYLHSNGQDVGPDSPENKRHEVLINIYRNQPDLAQVCERMVDLDEGIMEWRYRHVKMVERTIGRKIGTGGSAGAQYLQATLFKPFFPDLWAIRSEF